MLNVAFGVSSRNKISVYKWYKRFHEGREDVEDDERPGRPRTSTTDDNVENVCSKWVWTIAKSLSEVSNERCDSKICSEITEFQPKAAPNGYFSRVGEWSQRRSRTTQTGYNWWRKMGMMLKLRPNRPNRSFLSNQDKKKLVKFDRMRRFYLLFSSIPRT